jgi:hypothetical protein
MDVRPGPPVGLVPIEAHEQLKVTQRPKAEFVERLDRRFVSRHGLDVHIRRSAPTRFLHCGLDEAPAHTSSSVAPVDDNWLDRGLVTFPVQAGETDDGAIVNGDPGGDSLGERVVLVEASAWMVAADRGVGVDLAMVLDELRVQSSARIEIAGQVLTNLHWADPGMVDLPRIAGSRTPDGQ